MLTLMSGMSTGRARRAYDAMSERDEEKDSRLSMYPETMSVCFKQKKIVMFPPGRMGKKPSPARKHFHILLICNQTFTSALSFASHIINNFFRPKIHF